MITLPPEYKAIRKFPGYFWNTNEQKLYSIKNGGILKPLKPANHLSGYGPCDPHYQVSINGNRRYIFLHKLDKLLVDPYEIPSTSPFYDKNLTSRITITARDLLKEWLELHDTECRFDHHGYCQEHFLEDKEDCIVAKTRNFIDES